MTDERRPDDRVGDAAVDAAWRHAGREEPPARVDDAILAAARAAVHRDAQARRPAPAPRHWARWQPLAAAAGVIGLSFLLVQLLPRDEPERRPAASGKQGAPRAESASAPAESTPAQAAPSTATPAARDAASAASAEREAGAAAAPPSTPEAAAKPAAAPVPEPPAGWASRIAALHDAGDIAAATAELRAFRAAYPDAEQYLPESLREWARSVSDDGTR